MSSNIGGMSGGADEGEVLTGNGSPQGPLLLSERPTLVGVSENRPPVISPGARARRFRVSWRQVGTGIVASLLLFGFHNFLSPPPHPIGTNPVHPVPLYPNQEYDFSHDHPSPVIIPVFPPPVATATSVTAPTNGPTNYADLPSHHGQLLCYLAPEPIPHVHVYFGPPVLRPLAVSDDGKFVAVGLRSPGIGVWDTSSGKLVHTLKYCSSQPVAILFSADDQTLIVGQGKGVEFWNVNDGSVRITLNAHSACFCGMSLSPDGKTLATAGRWTEGDGRASEIKLWDTQTGTLKRIFSKSELNVVDLAFSPDGTRLAAIGGTSPDASELALWDLRSAHLPARRSLPHVWIKSLAFSPDNETLAIGTINLQRQTSIVSDDGYRPNCYYAGEVELWESHTLAPLRTIRLHAQPSWIAYGKDSHTLLALEMEQRVEILNLDGKQARLFYPPEVGQGRDGFISITRNLSVCRSWENSDEVKLVRTLRTQG